MQEMQNNWKLPKEAQKDQWKVPKEAQAHSFPPKHFYSVEYPGYVAPGSVPIAIHNLGGQVCLDNAFRRIKRHGAHDNVVDLRFQSGNPFSHPVPGDVTSTNNLVLKVVKRKRKTLDVSESGSSDTIGEYTAEIIGTIPKTLRFRSLVDFQYQPDMSDPLAQLRCAMDKLDAQAVKQFTIKPEQEDYTLPNLPVLDPSLVQSTADATNDTVRSNLRLFPPPLFSRQGIPLMYNFRQNVSSALETSTDELTGQERTRYINKCRWKGWSVITISIYEKELPTQPFKQVEEMRPHANKRLYDQLQKLFEERPIWTKLALINQFSPFDAREISNTKYLIPLFCYNFIDGPWRDAMVRFGYDPRTDRGSRFYQRIYFRNVNNPSIRPSVAARAETRYPDNISSRSDGLEFGTDRKSHIFDGVTYSSETASFQLLDIHDEMLKRMIDTEDELRDELDERDGWYKALHLEGIKVVLRHKFFLLLEGRIATDEQCQALLDSLPETRKSVHGPTYTRVRKHNKAKGAVPPEEEAAVRLRKRLRNDEAQL